MNRKHTGEPGMNIGIQKNRTSTSPGRFFSACGIISLCLAVLLAAGCKKAQQAPAAPPPEVMVMTIAQKNAPVSFDYVAQTESSQQVNIQARVNGFLDKRVYTEGSIVKTGQVLFLMDKKPFQAQVNAAAAALARQKAAMETARLNLERTKPLAAQNALSKKDLDDATGAYESSAASVNQAKAQLDTAQLNLSYCTIASPVNGITGAALQQDGTYINVLNSQLTTVSVLSPMWVNFSISEQQILSYRDQIDKKQIIPPRDGAYDVEIILVDGSTFPYRGRITFAAPLYNPQTGTFLLRVTVDNPDGLLRPNQYVTVRLHGAIRPNAILIPQRAVQQGAKGHFVWVIGKDGKAEPRPVLVGDWLGDDWFITLGLQSGDTVVVDGGLTLQPGVAVISKPAVAAAAQSHAAPHADPAHKSN
jgi:membrane fusion protein, multidrug efflux system